MRLRPATIVTVLLASACGSAPTKTVVAPPPAKPVAVVSAPPITSPAHWSMRASGPIALDGKLETEAGTLYVGRGGARWLDRKSGGPIAAEVLLPQALTGVLRGDDGRFFFVGESGTVFVTKDPLGPVIETRAPKMALRAVAVGKKAILGLSRGGLERSTDAGLTWTGVALPKTSALPLQIAALPTGEAMILLAPQSVLASEDDGQTFAPVPTLGVGARRIVADVNGDLVLEGATASAALRHGPLRFEKLSHTPASGYELPVPEGKETLLGADAMMQGTGAFAGDRWVEVSEDPESEAHFKLSIATFGKPATTRHVSELDGCERVHVGAAGSVIFLGCTSSVGEKMAPKKTPWGPQPSYGNRYVLKLFRSDDGGKTFKDDGTLPASEADKHIWLEPDGALLVDGACKRNRNDYECAESPPVVRLAGAKTPAKVVNGTNVRFDRVVFSPTGRAYALGTDINGRPTVFVSSDGGKDFQRRPLVPFHDDKHGTITPAGESGTLSVDDAGVIYAIVPASGLRWIRYVSTNEGQSFTAQLVELEADSIDLVGKRGLAYETSGRAWETADGGATWQPVGAPEATGDTMPHDRLVACGAYGCWIGAHAARIGWDLPLGAAATTPTASAAPKKTVYATPLKCTADTAWQTLVATGAPGSGNADLGGGTRWIETKRDPIKGSMAAIVATNGPKGLEIKEVQLFGPAPADSAGTVVMQVEGVAALRYSFKRDKTATAGPPSPPKPSPKPGGKMPMPMPMPSWPPSSIKYQAITPKQTVDVEVAWYLAATGKVHHATIKNAGVLDPARDVWDQRDLPSIARTGLLSIAAGGIHVRPFVSAGNDAPLWFASDAGKVDKLVFPELPTRDARGRTLSMRVDAARINGKSVVFGESAPGLQIFTAWTGAKGQSSENRGWALWPEGAGDAMLRFVDSGNKPILGVLWTQTPQHAAGGAAVALETGKNDPDILGSLPSQADLGDPPRACDASPLPWRVPTSWSPGTRHPVIVTLDGQEQLLATTQAVIRTGPGAQPCMKTIEAQSLKGGSDWYTALLPLDDLGHASLFRNTWKSNSGPSTLEVQHRTMTCTFEKGPLPEAYSAIAGFSE